MEMQERRRGARPARKDARSGTISILGIALVVLVGLGAASQMTQRDAGGLRVTLASIVSATPSSARNVMAAGPSADAFGLSGEVKVRFALPRSLMEYPLQVSGNPAGLRYQWVRAADGQPADAPRPVNGSKLLTPGEPGFYHLSLLAGARGSIVDELTVAVLVPFEQKQGVWLGGYRIGYYRGEYTTDDEDRPPGFVRLTEADASMQLSRHLRVSDFITHDGQEGWPRYVALDARLLDKIELVIAELSRWRGAGAHTPAVRVDVHSGFRTPWHNDRVRHAARDSRHQYGDAADVVIDADGDGRFTSRDTYLIEVAVDQVELRHPELAGGTGIYRGRYSATPYVHIDTRGNKARWKS
jgi:hypothetical protein